MPSAHGNQDEEAETIPVAIRAENDYRNGADLTDTPPQFVTDALIDRFGKNLDTNSKAYDCIRAIPGNRITLSSLKSKQGIWNSVHTIAIPLHTHADNQGMHVSFTPLDRKYRAIEPGTQPARSKGKPSERMPTLEPLDGSIPVCTVFAEGFWKALAISLAYPHARVVITSGKTNFHKAVLRYAPKHAPFIVFADLKEATGFTDIDCHKQIATIRETHPNAVVAHVPTGQGNTDSDDFLKACSGDTLPLASIIREAVIEAMGRHTGVLAH